MASLGSIWRAAIASAIAEPSIPSDPEDFNHDH